MKKIGTQFVMEFSDAEEHGAPPWSGMVHGRRNGHDPPMEHTCVLTDPTRIASPLRRLERIVSRSAQYLHNS